MDASSTDTGRALATIDTILDIQPIPGADAIERATIRGWHIVVKKGEFSPGDPCVFIEIDSLLPLDSPHFAFLAGNAVGRERFRVRTAKFRGQISQGIAFPLSVLPGGVLTDIGSDVTASLNITKFEPAIPACLAGQCKGLLPPFVRKTDEDRVQNLRRVLPTLAGREFYTTEKVDGTSTTYYLVDGQFGVCSRNMELRETEGNLYWDVARRLDIEGALRSVCDGDIVIQGEIVGPGVQGNRLKLDKHRFLMFRVANPHGWEVYGLSGMEYFAEATGIETVPILETIMFDPDASVDSFVAYATRNSEINPKVKAEGVVFRTTVHDPYFSFKAINPEFLLKHGE